MGGLLHLDDCIRLEVVKGGRGWMASNRYIVGWVCLDDPSMDWLLDGRCWMVKLLQLIGNVRKLGELG